ncbi:ion channel [Brevirhabdus sp.]|uniref:ion channel n=1 Tax=Brevirhabdus sp. TaxID=2004514 RepID=UPI004058FC43
MIPMIFIALVSFVAIGMFHFLILSRVAAQLWRSDISLELRHLTLLSLIGVLHATEALGYAAVFEGAQAMGLGGFKPLAPLNFMDVYYFSIVNYTTLGLGDVYPSGHLRFLAGVESLGGFLMLSCSASFLFNMNRQRAEQVSEE